MGKKIKEVLLLIHHSSNKLRIGENTARVWQRCVVAIYMDRLLSKKKMHYLRPSCMGKSVILQDVGMKRGFPGGSVPAQAR